ncbi:pyridoxamine 5'-phosphate oxidase family protein [Dermatophilaceae bacterium Soc4.6]
MLLGAWLPPDDDPDQPRMTLSTVTPDGGADARTVLLSGWDGRGFRFNTAASSRKVAQLAEHPDVALTLLWDGFSRQLVIQGRAELQSADELAATYAKRSPFLQQLAHQNTVDYAQLPLEQRRAQFAALAAAHPEGFAQPSEWTGYLVRPRRLTFWVTGVDTASRRTEFTLVDGAWQRQLLPG